MYTNHTTSKTIAAFIVFIWTIIISLTYIYDGFDLKNLSIITLLNNITLFICANYINKKRLTVFMLFLYVSCIIHFGQLWTNAFSIRNEIFNALTVFPKGITIEASVFCLISINIMVFIAILLGKVTINTNNKDALPNPHSHFIKMYSNNQNKKNLNNIALFGLILFLITILPTIYIDYAQISAVASAGYGAIFNIKFEYGIGLLRSLFPLAIICIMVGNQNYKRRVAPLMIFILLRSLILLLFVGNRSGIMVQLVIYIFIYYVYINPDIFKNIKVLAAYSTIIIIFIIFMPYVALTRENVAGNISFIDFIKLNNPLILLIQELGGSIFTSIMAIEWTQQFGFSFGSSFGNSALIFIPFSSSIITPGAMTVADTLNTISPMKALGGSFLAEFYFSFGWYSLFLLAPLTFFIVKLSESLTLIKQTSSFKTPLNLFLLYGVFMYIRGHFYDLAQTLNTIIYALILYYIYMSIRRLSSN